MHPWEKTIASFSVIDGILQFQESSVFIYTAIKTLLRMISAFYLSCFVLFKTENAKR